MQAQPDEVVATRSVGAFRAHFERNARQTSARKALIAGPSALSYGDLFDRVARSGPWLESLGVGPGDRVVLLSENDAALASLFFGIIAHGVTAVMLNPRASRDELAMLIEASDASAIVADTDVIETQRLSELDCVRFPVIGVAPSRTSSRIRGLFSRREEKAAETYPGVLSAFTASTSLPDVDDETIAYILFTSGTTSRPKGVQISHRSLFAQMATFVRQYGLSAESRLLNILPLHHTDGLTHGVVVAMAAGATVYRPMRFSIDRLPELLDQQYKDRITHFMTVPSVLSLIRQLGAEFHDTFDYPEFEFVISTAAYLDPNVWESFEDDFRVRVVNVYGLTETVCEACYCGPDDASYRRGTVGKPVDCEARIVDRDGADVPAGESGELVLRGDNVMTGYFRMPEATQEVLRDGWFHTGDLARIDADGFVHIVGRKKSVIVTGGHNVYPEDVTNVIRRIDGVLDAVVFGLPDDVWGEKVVACVVPASGVELTVEAVAAGILRMASDEKLPRDIHIVEELPRGPAGKVVLAEVRSMALALEQAKVEAADDSLESVLIGLGADVFKAPRESLNLDSGPGNTPGWNSLAHVEFLMSIEKHYGIRLEARDIMNIDSIRQAVGIVLQKLDP